jgi:hypothetical protein
LLQQEYAETAKQNFRPGEYIMTTDSNNHRILPQSTDYYAERAQRRAERAQYRAERHAARYAGGGAWIIGVALIAFGVIILLQNAGVLYLQNWWALFILIPALGSFAAAYGVYHTNGGRLNSTVRGSIIGGLVFTAIAAFFLLNLNAGLLLPALLILAGVGMLINTALPD